MSGTSFYRCRNWGSAKVAFPALRPNESYSALQSWSAWLQPSLLSSATQLTSHWLSGTRHSSFGPQMREFLPRWRLLSYWSSNWLSTKSSQRTSAGVSIHLSCSRHSTGPGTQQVLSAVVTPLNWALGRSLPSQLDNNSADL